MIATDCMVSHRSSEHDRMIAAPPAGHPDSAGGGRGDRKVAINQGSCDHTHEIAAPTAGRPATTVLLALLTWCVDREIRAADPDVVCREYMDDLTVGPDR